MPAVAVAIADCDGDRRNDILIGNGDIPDDLPLSPNQLLLSNGNRPSGNHQWSSDWFGAGKAAGFAVADFDADGILDVYIANGYEEPDQVSLSGKIHRLKATENEIRFVDSGQRLGQFASMDVELIDVDNDNDLGVVVANEGPESPNNIWLNDGKGVFNISESNSPGQRFRMALRLMISTPTVCLTSTNTVTPAKIDSGSELVLESSSSVLRNSLQ